MKLKKMKLHDEHEIMRSKEMKQVLGGVNANVCTCRCYGHDNQELENLGEVKNGTSCWDYCLEKFKVEFKGHICK